MNAKIKFECPGPWDDEPDSMDWQHAGLQCHIRRHTHFGHLNGYVSIDTEHPFFERGYRDAALEDVDVHGGLTFANTFKESKDLWTFGFNTGHYGDIYPGNQSYTDFDSTYKDFEYVKAETEKLAEYLASKK